jgi:hypothetical protein
MASWFDRFRNGLAGLMIEFLVIQVKMTLATTKRDRHGQIGPERDGLVFQPINCGDPF